MVCATCRVCYYCVMGLFRGAVIHEINLQNSARATADPSLGGGWQGKAACGSGDIELFLPLESGKIRKERAERAKEICRRCPVLRKCLEDALEKGLNNESDGVLGGMTPRERREFIKSNGKNLD